MKEEIIIINNEPFYKIPNGTSCNYAPIPKEFKPYFEKLEEENKSLQSQLKAKEEAEKEFIKYLESEIRASESGRTYIKGMCFIRQREGLLEEILSKYKEIVEEKHEIQNK